MDPHVEIVSKREQDVEQLFGLAKTAFAGNPRWSDRRVLDALREDVVFVAREHGRPAGYVAIRQGPDRTMVVEQLFVAPGHEHHGIGHRLLAHAEGYAIAGHADTLFIEVEEDNVAARSFYRRSGFVPVDRELFELVLPRLG